MEHFTSLVGSRGILKSCDAHNLEPISSNPQIDADILDRLRHGGSVYVCTDALSVFAEHYLPRISSPFTLVSGDSDVPVDAALLANPAMQRLLASPLLQQWHAQNLAHQHPKLHALPIGLDYHTMWARPGLWGLTAISPMAQENALINTLAGSPEFTQRYLSAYCNWHFAMGRGDRQECHDRIDKSVCFFEPHAVPRQSTWLRQSECMFVLSPEGAGMDCHRTWEALLLGCVPIVKRNALTKLFAQLPVLVVEDWNEVRHETLLHYAQGLGHRQFDFSALFREHWIRKIAGSHTVAMMPMRFADFRKMLTHKTG